MIFGRTVFITMTVYRTVFITVILYRALFTVFVDQTDAICGWLHKM